MARDYKKDKSADKEYTPLRKGRPRIKRICQQCDEVYYPANRTNNILYCGRTCYSKWQSLNQRGKRNHYYKGPKADYSALHHWIAREKGRPAYCEQCDKTSGKFEWANIDGKYRRELVDWIRLCVQCHRKYDKELRETTGAKSLWCKAFMKNKVTI